MSIKWFFILSRRETGVLEFAPRKSFQSSALQNVGKRLFAEWIVAISIFVLHAKMEKLSPSHSLFTRTSKIEAQAGCS